MPNYSGSLMDYGFEVHKRDNFVCQYCGLNGVPSFSNWLSLTVDHLLPKWNPHRANCEYQATACQFCNTVDNQYFEKANEKGLKFDGLSREELIDQRRPFVEEGRRKYLKFWLEKVQRNGKV